MPLLLAQPKEKAAAMKRMGWLVATHAVSVIGHVCVTADSGQ
jgi:hypothetical protein